MCACLPPAFATTELLAWPHRSDMATADIPESFWAEFDAEFGEEIAGLTESDHWWYVRGETDISDAKE